MTTELPDKPKSRKELYLAKIAGEDVIVPERPESRTEQYLAYIAENGAGAGAGTAGGANSTYGGLDLTDKYTLDELSAKVQSGDFSDLHIGDYVTKKVKVGSNQERELDFVIAGFDYFFGVGDIPLDTHHIVMVPDTAFYEIASMNGSNTTANGYYGSQMHGIASSAYTPGSGGALSSIKSDYEQFLNSSLSPTDGTYTFIRNASSKWELDGEEIGDNLTNYGITYTGTPVEGDTIVLTFAKGNLEPYRQAIYTAFGKEHILTFRDYMSLSNANAAWYSAKVELMNESMAYGQMIRANNSYGDSGAKSQLPLFTLMPNRVTLRRGKGGIRFYGWFSSIASNSHFCSISTGGNAHNTAASSEGAVRPYFLFA